MSEEYTPNIIYDPTPYIKSKVYRKQSYVSQMAEQSFINSLKNMNAILKEKKYLGIDKKHCVECEYGILHWITPHSIAQGKGICKCSISINSFNIFKRRLDELNAILEYPDISWMGNEFYYSVICKAGNYHMTNLANIRRSDLCRCMTTMDYFDRFKLRINELRATLISVEYLGCNSPHTVVCANGHINNNVIPSKVLNNDYGVCKICAWDNQNTFYILTGKYGLKFGITSNIKSRINDHFYDGYVNIVKILRNLPPFHAGMLEAKIMNHLKSIKIFPIIGNEYFDISVLSIVVMMTEEYENEHSK